MTLCYGLCMTCCGTLSRSLLFRVEHGNQTLHRAEIRRDTYDYDYKHVIH